MERAFSPDEIVVTKTDPSGAVVHANDVFINIGGWSENDLLNRPHNMVRHPDMRAVVFKLLWERAGSGREFFAYIQNRRANGDHCRSPAHVTPDFDQTGRIVGRHSSRRVAGPRT